MPIQLKKHKPSGTIVLDHPQTRNAIQRSVIEQLREALSDFHQEKGVRAVILTGAGACFCSGFDLREIQNAREGLDALQQWHEDAMAVRDLLTEMLQFPKPLIAAVNGPAAGLGAALMLACDIVVGSPTAQVSFPESRRGLAAGLVAPLLVFRQGAGIAANLLLTGRVVEHDECVARGIFHESVATDMLWARSHGLAQQCAEAAPESIQITKQLLNETIGDALRTQLTAGAAASATARTTEAAVEGVDAFLEKRPPQWP